MLQVFGRFALGVSSVNQRGMSFFADFEHAFGLTGYKAQRFSLGLRFEL